MPHCRPPIKILAVDDLVANLMVIESVVADLGVSVVKAITGREALRLVLEQDFALILLDVNMPGLDGFETARLIRERQRSKNIPIIFLTASPDKDIGLRRAYELGAIDYLIKPIDLVILRAKISGFVELASARAQLAAYASEQERRARHSEEKFRSIVETIQEWIWEVDAWPRFTFSNRRVEDFLGYSADEILGRNPMDLVHEGDRSRADAVFTTLRSRPDDVTSLELRLVHKQGGIRWLDFSATVLFDDDGQFIGFRGSSRNVTEKKDLEAKFLRAQRLESIGALAGGIAHDLNNVLSPILMSVELLRMKYSSEQDGKLLDNLESSARRGASLVQQILSFARGTDEKFAVLDLNRVVKEVEQTLKQTFPPTIHIVRRTPPDLWPINGEATHLHQVLMNLCVNARDAMPGGGKLELAVQNVTLDEQFVSQQPDARPGPYVLLTISDTGSGIPPEIIDKIFDPFFTTKEAGKGTGLGLATVLGIVKGHGGFFKLKSRIGAGTQFSIYLPAQPSAAQVASPDPQEPPPSGQGELILVVDDESAVRAITKATLEAHGYQTLTASDGIEALSLFVQRQSEIEVVLTDLSMPFDGIALIRALRRIQPQTRAVLMSGQGDLQSLTEIRDLSPLRVLQKPFNAENLLMTLRETLDSAQSSLISDMNLEGIPDDVHSSTHPLIH